MFWFEEDSCPGGDDGLFQNGGKKLQPVKVLKSKILSGRQAPKQRTPLSRRASCREASTTERSPAFERSGSLRALPSLPPRGLRRGSLLSPSLGEVGNPHLDGVAPGFHHGGAPNMASTKNNAASNAPSSPRPDRGLFLNLTGALFGEGKLQQVLSPTRTGETFFGKSTNAEKARKASTPGGSSQLGGGEDVFTQFSQYGSRAHLAQPDPQPTEQNCGTRRKTSFDQVRSSEHRRHRKTDTKGRCRSREKSCEEVVIRVTDTDLEPDLVQTNQLQTSCLVAPRQQQQEQQHEQEEKEHTQHESPAKSLQDILPKSNSSSHCHPIEGHRHDDGPGQNLSHQDPSAGHPQGHPDTPANHDQDAFVAQNPSHRNALGHNAHGVSGRWAKKKAPKMPPLHLGGDVGAGADDDDVDVDFDGVHKGGEAHTTESIRTGFKDAKVVKGLGDKVISDDDTNHQDNDENDYLTVSGNDNCKSRF